MWIITELIKWGKSDPDIKRIFLYGSRFRGDFRPDSDLDLAVEVWDEPEPDTLIWSAWRPQKKIKLESTLSGIIGLQVHLEYYDSGNRNLTPHIKTAILLGSKIIYDSGIDKRKEF